MNRSLIVFAKEPIIGRVKTRLENKLSRETCLDLYKCFLKDILDTARIVDCDSRILAYESAGARPVYLENAGAGFIFHKQSGYDLGRRMDDAFRFARKRGAKATVIIGSDSPTLTGENIDDAYSALEKKDIVVGPCDDGGYYLIGLKEPSLELFSGIEWSRSGVLLKTLENIKTMGKSVSVLKEWYDIDDEKGLGRLISDFKSHECANASWTGRLLMRDMGRESNDEV